MSFFTPGLIADQVVIPATGAASLLAVVQAAAVQLAARHPGHTFTELHPVFEMDGNGSVTVRVLTTVIPPGA